MLSSVTAKGTSHYRTHVSDDATIDEFLESGEPEEKAEADEEPEPAVSTYAWSPEGGACADCDELVETRWRDDGDLVCADCKEW